MARRFFESLSICKQVDLLEAVVALHRDNHLTQALEHFRWENGIRAAFGEWFDRRGNIDIHPDQSIELGLERLLDKQATTHRCEEILVNRLHNRVKQLRD